MKRHNPPRLSRPYSSAGFLLPLLVSAEPTVALETTGAQPPTVVSPIGGAFLVNSPDGGVEMIFAQASGDAREVARKRTTDHGRSWSQPESVLKLPGPGWGAPLPLLTKSGELQFFWMVARGARRKPAVDYFIDVWQAHSSTGQSVWTKPQRIFEGYVGSINGMTQLRGGRIVLPFAYWVGGRPEAPPTGANITITVYSDDGGKTWKQSPAKLTAPCYENYNGSNYGAVEPTIIELKDGRVWMLIRTQTGCLYESFSPDGADWSEPKPSRFCSSDSPAWLVRLPDGRIVLFWNNCENTSRIDGQGVYTNRDALHAAISSDEGKTWRGYREVCRDPLRNESPPKRGDRGTAYPYAVATKDNKVLVVTGQGQGRRSILLVDPEWLCQTRCQDDFSGGLDGWCVFKAFGRPKGWWRDRTVGPRLVDHPDRPGAKVLHIRRPDEKDGDGAVWNFPLGRQGKLTVRLRLQPGFGGGSIALADRFIQPNDNVGEKKVLVTLPLGRDGALPGEGKLVPGRWHALDLNWDLDKAACNVVVDGKPACTLPMSKAPSPGVCYVRFRSTANAIDAAGCLIESVEADVSVGTTR
ncbi:MAG: exo-alpha-sialidase [Phycisphaerae bacterium]|nr:exo-alpha-sialidase [Phycisphaerae bacterium]